MKRIVILFAAVILLFPGSVLADNPPSSTEKMKNAVVEENLLVGLESGNAGLQVSCAYFLGEIQSDKAVIPLMRILHNEKDDRVRVAVALALMKIGDGRGIKAIKYAVQYDESEYVRNFCKKFYCYCTHKE
jgi:HEAT repeat protein